VIARVIWLIVAGMLFYVLAGVPARYLGGGDVALAHAGTAVLLCLVPGIITLLWAGSTLRRDPQQAPLMVLGASGVRMFGVLLVALVLFMQVPLYRDHAGFLFWVLGAYLFLLAVEIGLLLKGLQAGQSTTGKPDA